MEFQGFIGGSGTQSSLKVGVERSLNLYPTVSETTGLRALVSRPGLKKLSEAGTGPNRGNYTASNDRAFAASGGKLWEITDPVNPVDRGDFVTATGAVSMADNGIHLICVDGTKGYVLKFSDNTFAQISDPDFPVANYVCFIDNYLIVNDAETGNFFLSAISDATDWDGLDFAAAEGYPDDLVKLWADRGQLVLVGKQTTESWFDSGDALFPFSRVQNGMIEQGTNSPDSWQKLDAGSFGLIRDASGDGIVARFDGQSMKRVSTHAIEYLLGQSTNLAAATSWSYQRSGHAFYCLNAPGMAVTVCYDVTTGLWHERSTANARHRAEGHCVVGGKHIVADYENGNIYELSETTFDDDGEKITKLRRAPRLGKELHNVKVPAFRLDVETGTYALGYGDGGYGDVPYGDDQIARIALRVSRDGGHTFGNPRTIGLGNLGDYKKQIMWERLGMGRDLVFEVSTDAAMPIAMTAAYLDAGVARN